MPEPTRTQHQTELDQLQLQVKKLQKAEKERERAEKINRVLFAISNAVNTTENLNDLFENIHIILSQIIDVTNFHISLYDKRRDALIFAYIVDTVDITENYMEILNISDPNSPSHTSEVIRTGKPVITTKKQFLANLKQRNQKPLFSISEIWLGVPLKIKNEVIGAIAVHSFTDPNLYDESDIDILLSVSDQVAIAIDRKRKEDARKVSEKKYRDLVENIDDIIFSTNTNGAFTYISPAVEMITGYCREEITGGMNNNANKSNKMRNGNPWFRSFHHHHSATHTFYEDIIHPDDKQEVIDTVHKAYQNSTKFSKEYRIIQKGGRENWVLEKGQIFENENNEKYLEGIIFDIHERKRSDLVNETLFRISNAVNTTFNLDELYISIHTILNSIIDLSSFFIAMYDKQKDMISFPYYIDKVDKEIFENMRNIENISNSSSLTAKVIKNGKPLIIKKNERLMLAVTEAKKPIGTPAEIWIGIPLKVKSETIGVMVAQSYTDPNLYTKKDIALLHSVSDQVAIAIDRKQAEEALRKSIENANHLAKKAKSATISKSEFLANMSHEIRTPMNAIIGFTDLAIQTEFTNKQHEYLSLIKNSSSTLLGIINDILDFSKIEAGKLNLDHMAFDLYEVMDSLSDMFANTVAEKNIEMIVSVTSDIPSSLIGDPMRLKQILINLTNNAIKFTKNGDVIVSVALSEKQIDKITLEFSIEDTGIGISKEDIDTLFESFVQADTSTTRQYGGTGLGLSISKHLIEMMGGNIHVESVLGKGSKFGFNVNLGFTTDKLKYSNLIFDHLSGTRILVVDDSKASRHILDKILSSFSFTVKTVDSGKNALIELNNSMITKPYDLILMDWRMPELDGIETTKKIKKNASFGNTPIIMMTAYHNDEIMEMSEKCGVNAYLTKPIKQSILLDTIVDILSKKSTASLLKIPPSHKNIAYKIQLNGLRILLVEDNYINQQVVLEILKPSKAAVDTADDGFQAVTAIKNGKYDIVLMDIQMPVMDGYEATDMIRNKLKRKDLPIIAMTAHAMKGDREKCIHAGMDDYISKPIDTFKLFEALSRLTNRKFTTKNILVTTGKDREYDNNIPKNLPGINIKSCLDRLGGNWTVLKKLICDFNEQYSDTTIKIKEFTAKEDFESTLNLVHTIKGIAGNFSADELYKVSSEFGSVIKENKPDDLNRLIDRFDSAISKVLKAADIIVSYQSESDSRVSLNLPEIKTLMRQLNTLLSKNDVESENCLNHLKPFLIDSGLKNDAEQLEGFISFFEFDSANMILSAIAAKLNISMDENRNGN